MLIEEPMFSLPRRDKVEPMLRKSSTEAALPSRVAPYTESEAAARVKLR
jgi:hypothetical protein